MGEGKMIQTLLAAYSPAEPPTTPDAWGMVMLLGIAAFFVSLRRLKRHPHWTQKIWVLLSAGGTLSCGVEMFGGADLWLWVIWGLTAAAMFAVYAQATADHVSAYSQQWFLFLSWCCLILAVVTLVVNDVADGLMFTAFAVCGFAAWAIRTWQRRRAGR